MKINICKKLDLDELERGIALNESNKSESYVSYLIMNSKTFHSLKIECNAFKPSGSENYYCAFSGRPIAICENLDYGEVDIR